MRVACSSGLTPDQFFSMTFREIELWLEGREDHWDRVMEMMAWIQANLMTMQAAKGSKVTIDAVLPNSRRRKKASENRMPEFYDADGMKAAMKAFNEKREHEKFWKSLLGRRLDRSLHPEEYEDEDQDQQQEH